LDAAVERIREPNLPRIRYDHQSIPLRGIEIDRADQGEAAEDERQAPSGDSIRFVDKTQMQVGTFGGAGVSIDGDVSKKRLDFLIFSVGRDSVW
jgi:hypothetical protein